MGDDDLLVVSQISIHALLTESDGDDPVARVGNGDISIHALLTESDERAAATSMHTSAISIHALLTESDYIYLSSCTLDTRFQSTLSSRRATR